MKALKHLFIIFAVVWVGIGLVGEETTEGIKPGYKGRSDEYKNFIEDLEKLEAQLKVPLPYYFSWKDLGGVTPSKDQGSYPTCWVYAAVGAVESKIKIFYGQETDISEQHLLCCYKGNGCSCWNKGTVEALGFYETHEPRTEACAPLNCTDMTATSCEAIQKKCNALSYKGTHFYTLDMNTGNDEVIKDIKLSTLINGPPVLAMFVGNDFLNSWWYSADTPKGAVYYPCSEDFGHVVVVIGWDDGKEAFLCKNSMGEKAGPNGDGTFWVAYPGSACPAGKNPVSYKSYGAANIIIIKNEQVEK